MIKRYSIWCGYISGRSVEDVVGKWCKTEDVAQLEAERDDLLKRLALKHRKTPALRKFGVDISGKLFEVDSDDDIVIGDYYRLGYEADNAIDALEADARSARAYRAEQVKRSRSLYGYPAPTQPSATWEPIRSVGRFEVKNGLVCLIQTSPGVRGYILPPHKPGDEVGGRIVTACVPMRRQDVDLDTLVAGFEQAFGGMVYEKNKYGWYTTYREVTSDETV